MLCFSLEQMLWNNAPTFTSREKANYSKIYRIIGENVLSAHPVEKANNQVEMTLHPTENGYTAVLIKL